MAERRMFSKNITESDAFLDMPQSSQNLYFHLNMNADDDGFVNSPRKVQRTVGASNDDFNILLAKSFLIPFESGVVVIKHWKIHNYIRSDRYKPTTYIEEKSKISIKENGAYTLSPLGIPNDYQPVDERSTQDRLGKDSIGKDSIGEEEQSKIFKQPSIEEVKQYCQERNNRVDAERFIDFYASKGWMIGKTKMKDWRAAVRTWEKNDKERKPDIGTYTRPKCKCGGEFNPGGFCKSCGAEIS